MKRTRYSEEQIAFALRQAESGTPVTEVCRKMGVTEQSFYRWKRKYAGMGVAELRRLKLLEDENRRLKQLVADPPPVSVPSTGLKSGLSSCFSSYDSCPREPGWSHLAQCAVRTVIVVVLPPFFNLQPGIGKRQEPVLVQTLLSHPAIERLDEGVIRRFAGSREVQLYPVRVRPLIQYL